MWHKLQEDPPYLLLSRQINSYEIYITDYISIWFVYFKKNDFLICLQDSNFGLEVKSEEEFLQKGADLLRNPTNLRKLGIKKGASTLEVSMSKLFEYPLQLKLKLTEGSKEMFFQNVTYPLLKTVSDLKTSQLELRNLLKKKDDEIEEYKCEGKEIALRYLKTKQFNDEEHMNHHQVHTECAQLLEIPDTILEKIAATSHRNESIKSENTDNHHIKQEPLTPTESQSAPRLGSGDMKKEPKVESQNSFSQRKKRKQLLNY